LKNIFEVNLKGRDGRGRGGYRGIEREE